MRPDAAAAQENEGYDEAVFASHFDAIDVEFDGNFGALETKEAVAALMKRLVKSLEPPKVMTTTDWAREFRRLSPKATAKPGVYNPDLTPWVKGIHEALDDPAVFEVNCMKSAQVAWTDGVLLNFLGRRIDLDPAPMIVMFAKDQAAKEFNSEKFEPMVEATQCLADKIPITHKRDKDNRWAFKGFAGGFLKFVGSNSPTSVKSTPASIVCVEEPDDCNENVQQQGDTITLLKERTKTFARRKVIFGGTPTIEGFSRIESSYKASDQRKYWIPCPHCNEPQTLLFENIHWTSTAGRSHEVFGDADPESARYCCAHCSSLWTDAEKNRAVRLGQWRADAEFRGVAGFYINEVYSPFPGSQMARLVEKFLTANHALSQGDDTKMRSFRNNTEGLPYAFKSDVPEANNVREMAEEYAELTVPQGGLILTAGVDVQHDRLAVIIRAWGRGEESWLVFWGEIFGSTLIPTQGAWLDLDKLLTQNFRHASGADLRIAAASIDGSDGNRTEIVHDYVRPRRHQRFMAIKGASEKTDDRREIFSVPRKVDTGKFNRLAKRGLETFLVGTARAKDLILETRIKLQANGAGRMHWYAGVRADYWDQLVSEVKAPSRLNRMKKVWQKKAGVRNEALDCEVYALHAARSLKTNLLHDSHWSAVEQQLRQRTLISNNEVDVQPAVQEEDLEAAVEATTVVLPEAKPMVKPLPPRQPQVYRKPRSSSYSAGRW